MLKIAVLASGSGSNLQAIIDETKSGYVPAEIRLVLSDKADAYALTRAAEAGIEHRFVDPKAFGSREEYDAELVRILLEHEVEYVVLAGYMRIVSSCFLQAFPERVLNIHPALLPAFPGLHAQRQAFEYGVKVAGCTVHFVDEQMDSGPIIAQAPVPVIAEDTLESLTERILTQEHLLYPHVLRMIALGKVRLEGRKVYVGE